MTKSTHYFHYFVHFLTDLIDVMLFKILYDFILRIARSTWMHTDAILRDSTTSFSLSCFLPRKKEGMLSPTCKLNNSSPIVNPLSAITSSFGLK